MKKLLLLTFLLFPTIVFSQDVKELFLKIPFDVLMLSPESREKMITETKGDLLKFRLSEARRGEVKIFSQKSGETLFGMAVDNCDSSDIQFWKVKNGKWKLVTNEVIKPITAKDIPAILKVSPTTLENVNQNIGIAYFYNFHSDSTNIEMIARKADSCEVAGKVYDYKFNGKKFVVQK
jgi:hypothetical protein